MYYDEQSTFESATVVAHTPTPTPKAFNTPIWSLCLQQLTTMFTAPIMQFPMYYDEQSTLWFVAVDSDANMCDASLSIGQHESNRGRHC